MNNRYKLNDISLLQNRTIFFDANVMIYLFWPTAKSWEKEYALIFSHLLKQKNNINIDFIVISEIVNRIIRIEYDKFLQIQNITREICKFKDYRNSHDGLETLSDIYQIIKNKILKFFSIGNKIFTKTEIENFLLADTLDFNDKAIISLCKENNFVLLTNDKDYINADIDILTANPTF